MDHPGSKLRLFFHQTPLKEIEIILKWKEKRHQQRHISSTKEAFHHVRGSHHEN